MSRQPWHPVRRFSLLVTMLGCILACLSFPGLSLALELGTPEIHGYGTLGWLHDDQSQSAFVRDINQRAKDSLPDDQSWWNNDAWLRDSRLGLQASMRLSPELSVMSQVVLRDQITRDFGYYVDWALLAWTPLPETQLRLGRVGYDLFLISEQRNMGYGYPWIRPPVEFYGWIPLYSLDGADLSHALLVNGSRWRFKIQGGRSTGIGIPMDDDLYALSLDRLYVATLAYEKGPWQIKMGHSGLHLNREAKPLSGLHDALDGLAGAGLPAVEAQAAEYRRNMSFGGSDITLSTLGVVFDNKDWLVQAELGRVSAAIDMSTNHDMGYLAVARRLGDWTPYAMASAIRPHDAPYSASFNWGDGLPAALADGLNGLQQAAITAINSSRIDQETYTLGLRYDFNPWAALKWQWDSTRIHPDGYLMRPGTLLARSKPMTVQGISVALDFVF
ncbi:MAG: hypothetical protein HQL86_01400 [Magnetococcales bacterium]|nr:hypothetical protein [Magnetococcales bacterium]